MGGSRQDRNVGRENDMPRRFSSGSVSAHTLQDDVVWGGTY